MLALEFHCERVADPGAEPGQGRAAPVQSCAKERPLKHPRKVDRHPRLSKLAPTRRQTHAHGSASSRLPVGKLMPMGRQARAYPSANSRPWVGKLALRSSSQLARAHARARPRCPPRELTSPAQAALALVRGDAIGAQHTLSEPSTHACRSNGPQSRMTRKSCSQSTAFCSQKGSAPQCRREGSRQRARAIRRDASFRSSSFAPPPSGADPQKIGQNYLTPPVHSLMAARMRRHAKNQRAGRFYGFIAATLVRWITR